MSRIPINPANGLKIVNEGEPWMYISWKCFWQL